MPAVGGCHDSDAAPVDDDVVVPRRLNVDAPGALAHTSTVRAPAGLTVLATVCDEPISTEAGDTVGVDAVVLPAVPLTTTLRHPVVAAAYVAVPRTTSRTYQVPVDGGANRAVTEPAALVASVDLVVTLPLRPFLACTSTVRAAAGFTTTLRASSPPSLIVTAVVAHPVTDVETAVGVRTVLGATTALGAMLRAGAVRCGAVAAADGGASTARARAAADSATTAVRL